jgi:hypothetical protein
VRHLHKNLLTTIIQDMADIRLKTITAEQSNNLTVQKGNVLFTYTTPSTSTISASIVCDGGISINNSSDSTSSTSGGALTIGGGLAVSKTSTLGGNLLLDSNSSTLSVIGNTNERLFIDTISNKFIRMAPDGIDNKFTISDQQLVILTTQESTSVNSGGAIFSGGIGIAATENANSLGNGGAISVAGGLSIQKRTFIGGDTFIQGESTGTNDTAQIVLGPATDSTDFDSSSQIKSVSNSGTDASSSLEFYTHQAATSSVGTLQLTIDSNGDSTFLSNTPSTNSSTGTLSLKGGLSTADDSWLSNKVTISNSFTGNTSSTLLLVNSTADTAGTEADTRLVIESKSDGQSIIQLKNTLDTTTGSFDISASNTTFSIFQNETSKLLDINTNGLVLFNTGSSTSSTTGALTVPGGIGVEKNSFFNSLVHFDSTVELKGSSQVYHILGGGDTPNGIAFQGQSTAVSSSYNFFTADGDNTDNLAIKLFNLGTPNNVTNSESLEIVWDSVNTLYRISSNALGTGVNRGICFESGLANQLVLGTSGNVSINSTETNFKLHVNGTVNATGIVTITETSDATGLNNGSLQVEGGVSIEKYTYAGKGLTIGNGLTNNFSSGDTLLNFDTEQPWIFQSIGTGSACNLALKSTIHNTQFIIRDSGDNDRFTFQVSTSGSILTVNGTQIIDYTSSEAFVVRQQGDSGDVFVVNTTNKNAVLSNSSQTASLANLGLTIRSNTDSTFNVNSDIGNIDRMFMIHNDNTTGNTLAQLGMKVGTTNQVMLDQKLVRTGVTTGKLVFTLTGGPSLSISKDLLELNHDETITSNSSFLIDHDNTQALLIRKNGNVRNIFTVDSVNEIVVVNSTVESTSPDTGSLQVKGGLGVSGNLFIGGDISLYSTSDAINFTTGSIILNGGLTIQSTTNSTSITNGGAVLIAGGISIGKDTYLGGNIETTGIVLFKGTIQESTQYFDNTNTLRWAFGKTSSHSLFFNRYNTSGVIIDQPLFIDISTGQTLFNNLTPSTSTDATLKTTGGITILGTENASSLTSGGGLTVLGGAAINKDLYIGGNSIIRSTTQSNDTSSGSLIIKGGLAVNKNLHIGGDTIITGNLTVQGTTTSISSTTTLLADNIFVYNSGPAGTSDAGFLIERFQNENDTGTGDVVTDIPSLANTFPSQSGVTTTTAILHASASGSDDFYNNWFIKITSGFSSNQVRKISDYNGTTKTITINSAWTTQNPASSDTFEIFNKPFIGMIYNEVNDRFQLTGSDSDKGIGNVNYTDEIDFYIKNITLTGTKPSNSLSSAGLYSSGGASFGSTQVAASLTSGGCITAAGGVSIAKNLIVGTQLTVNGVSIKANPEDISQLSFNAANNQTSPANVTGLVFTNAGTAAFDAYVHIKVLATSNLYTHFHLRGVQRNSDWDLVSTFVGDSSGINFNINSAGQVQYTSSNYTGFTSLTIKFRAQTITS